jgi:hypothetical protein
LFGGFDPLQQVLVRLFVNCEEVAVLRALDGRTSLLVVLKGKLSEEASSLDAGDLVRLRVIFNHVLFGFHKPIKLLNLLVVVAH